METITSLRPIPGAMLLAILSTTFVLTSIITCQPTYNSHECLGEPNDTATTNYMSNLDTLLHTLASKASVNSFYNESFNGIYVLFLCRADVSNDTCHTCVNNASHVIRQHCSANKSAVIWYDQCMLRYSNTNFLGVAQTRPALLIWNAKNTTTPDEPNYGALGLVYSLIDSAPASDIKFGTCDRVVARGHRHGYALVQCTRDISSRSCRICLGNLTSTIQKYCQSKKGWRILSPSCYLRYEEYRFYEQRSAAISSAPNALRPMPKDGGKGGNGTTMIVIILVASFAAIATPLLGFWCYSTFCRKKRRKGISEIIEGLKELELEGGIGSTVEDESDEMHSFSLSTIKAATNNFSDENELGRGGFGPAYKGQLPNGDEIAVKRLSLKSSQGFEEFRTEVLLIVKLQHKNLVRLLGYCMERDEKLLVYEYMANTSLDALLFDQIKSKELDWAKRANIITGVARGILYLHEDSRLKIIHRDLKASNVLLDDEMNPKISDFGTAKIFGGKQVEANTERVVGTYGYMAPEYALEGLFSIKSDVYSFGILMLEIISGKKNRSVFHFGGSQSLLSYAWQLWHESKGLELIDTNIVDNCPVSEVLRWIQIALLCAQDDPAIRPTMSLVVLMLGSKAVELPLPSTAPYSVGMFTSMSEQSSTIGARTGPLPSDQSSTSASS